MNKILIVEDDILNIAIITKLLEKRGGYNVVNSEDVEEILKLCLNQNIQLIIMDVSLKNSYYQGEFIDGIKITKLIKNNPKINYIPVILTTAHAMRGDRETFLKESGADGYISKPIVDHDKFIQTIEENFNNKPVH